MARVPTRNPGHVRTWAPIEPRRLFVQKAVCSRRADVERSSCHWPLMTSLLILSGLSAAGSRAVPTEGPGMVAPASKNMCTGRAG
ncbi:unnamed protein product [Gadus morhua 'NCC']